MSVQPILFKRDLLPWFDQQVQVGSKLHERILHQFKELIQKQPSCLKKADMCQIADDVKWMADQSLGHIQKSLLSRPQFAPSVMNQPLLPNREEMAVYKVLSRELEQQVHKEMAEFIENCIQKCLSVNASKDFACKLAHFKQTQLANLWSEEGKIRFEMIHQAPLWDPDTKLELPMVFKGRNYVKYVSRIRVAGPTKSSQAPRHEKEANAVVPNFFHTEYFVECEGKKRRLLDMTRSAATVEFDQPNEQERERCNRALVKQVLDANVEIWLNQFSPEQLSEATAEKPLVFRQTTVNLFTPDIWRHLLAKSDDQFKKFLVRLHPKLAGARADDERALAEENYLAHDHWHGETTSYVLKDQTGKEKTISVKYDLLFFNTPCNKLSEATPNPFQQTPLLKKANRESWKQLCKCVVERDQTWNKKINKDEELLAVPGERAAFARIREQGERVLRMRRELMDEALKTNKLGAHSFGMWNCAADLARRVVDLKRGFYSEQFVELVDLFQKRHQLTELFLDTRELRKLMKRTHSVALMDKNRFALTTRLIYLSTLVENGRVYFGCRSGKDRTGLVDIELKLLATLATMHGRIPSYREQEKMKGVNAYRKTLILQSENILEVPLAALGAPLGLNIQGSAYTIKAVADALEAAKAGASFARRPRTKAHVPAAFKEKWQRIRPAGYLRIDTVKI